MSDYKAVFYNLPNGTEPAKDFLEELDAKMFTKLLRAIEVLEADGPAVREPYSKHLDDGIFEVRAQAGNNISRVLYFFFTGQCFVLTHGFVKKTQKTPPSEIARAKKYREEYQSRKDEKK